MRTKEKTLQHNRPDADSFVSVERWKQTENCTDIFEWPIKILETEILRRDAWKPEAHKLLFCAVVDLPKRQQTSSLDTGRNFTILYRLLMQQNTKQGKYKMQLNLSLQQVYI